MNRLPVIRDHGQLRVFDPATGEELDLPNAPTETLAKLRAYLRVLEADQRDVKRLIDHVLLTRMDRDAKWTVRVPGFELSAGSPAPRSVFDGPALREALMDLVDEGLVSVGAVDAAVETVVSYKPRAAGVRALRKLGGRVAEVVAGCEVLVEPERRVSVKETPAAPTTTAQKDGGDE